MPRTYSAAVVAVTTGVSKKWLDNLLSHNEIPGAPRGRQGIQRQISEEGLLAIEVIRLLVTELGLPLGQAARLTRTALEARTSSEALVSTDAGWTLTLNLGEIERRLRERMLEAVESVARIPRGRPRKLQ